MASTKEIKNRISSVRNTQKITNAMYLISSTKMRKAKGELDKTRPYFTALKEEVERIFLTAEDVDSRYFEPAEGIKLREEACGCLVITADKGLAGAYNQNVLREAHQLCQKHPDMKLFVVGEYGRQFFLKHRIPIEKSFLYTAQNPTMQRAREIGEILLEWYDAGRLDEIFIIYTDLTGAVEEVKHARLLPFHRQHFVVSGKERENIIPFEFHPSASTVLDNIMHSYIFGYIYSALVDSFCSEQTARMTAMSSANQNAAKILEELSIQYHLVRQAAITREITEVSSGARAQKRKKRK